MEWSINLKQHLGPRRTDRARKLTEAGIICFATRGFAHTRVEHITETAGLSRSQFYYFFEDKTDCFTACHRLCLAELEARITEAVDDSDDWRQQLQRGIEVVVTTLSQNPYMARFVLLEAQLAGTETDRESRQVSTVKLAGALEQIYRQAAPETEITPFLSDVAIGSARQILSRRLEDDILDPEETASELAVALTLSVLGPEGAGRLAEVIAAP